MVGYVKRKECLLQKLTAEFSKIWLLNFQMYPNLIFIEHFFQNLISVRSLNEWSLNSRISKIYIFKNIRFKESKDSRVKKVFDYYRIHIIDSTKEISVELLVFVFLIIGP